MGQLAYFTCATVSNNFGQEFIPQFYIHSVVNTNITILLFLFIGRIPTDEFVEQLKTSVPLDEMIGILEKLRVAVGTYHINWLHDFANKNGHVMLLNLMNHWNSVRPDESKCSSFYWSILIVEPLQMYVAVKLLRHLLQHKQEIGVYEITLVGPVEK